MYYKQPRYFKDFKCIGSACVNNCCYGWEILWKKSEIDKVLNAENISAELKELVEKSFSLAENSKDEFIIKFGDNERCPLQTKEGLCKIQKDLGANYLSSTCTDYPRNVIFSPDTLYRFCHLTCPVIVEKLLNDKHCMEMVIASDGEPDILINRPRDVKKYPEQIYRTEIFELLYEIISDKNIEIERAIMLGSIAAERLAQIVGREDYDAIPDEIKLLRNNLRNSETLNVVNGVQQNLQVKLGFLPLITEQIIKQTVTDLLHINSEYIDLEAYKHGEEQLHRVQKEHSHFLRNLALSLLFDLDVPFRHSDKSIFENYVLFAVTFACIKLNIISALSVDDPIMMRVKKQEFTYDSIDRKITGLTSILCRNFCHNLPKQVKIIEKLKENDYINHAYLAAFIL